MSWLVSCINLKRKKKKILCSFCSKHATLQRAWRKNSDNRVRQLGYRGSRLTQYEISYVARIGLLSSLLEAVQFLCLRCTETGKQRDAEEPRGYLPCNHKKASKCDATLTSVWGDEVHMCNPVTSFIQGRFTPWTMEDGFFFSIVWLDGPTSMVRFERKKKQEKQFTKSSGPSLGVNWMWIKRNGHALKSACVDWKLWKKVNFDHSLVLSCLVFISSVGPC